MECACYFAGKVSAFGRQPPDSELQSQESKGLGSNLELIYQ